MTLLVNTVIALVALLHVYFLVLEMFFWTKPRGLRIFGQTLEKAKASEVLAKNQGLYNGFLAAGLVWGLMHPSLEVSFQIEVFFLICVIIAGACGAMTVNKRILFIQAGPAALALALIVFR